MPQRHSTSEQLAALTAIVERIDKRAEEDRTERKSEAKAAQESRAAVKLEMQRHGQQIEGLEKRVAMIEPVAEMATGFKAKLLGASFVLGLIGSTIMFTLSFFKDRVAAFFGG